MKRQSISISVAKALSIMLACTLFFMTGAQPAYAAKKKKAFVMDEMTRLTLVVDAFNAANTQRQLAGLPPLTWSQDLFNAAEVRSNETVVLFEHVRPDGTSCTTAAPGIMSGENILKGNSNNVKSGAGAIDTWMNSPGHKANILNTSYTTSALSLRYVNGFYYWVQVFG